MRSQYAEARRRMHEQEQAGPATHCEAHGCPLAPSITHNAGKSWFCALHAGAPLHELAAINAAIRDNAPLLEVIAAGRQLLAWASASEHAAAWCALREKLDRHGYEVPPHRGVGDGLGAWLYRVETLLGELVSDARTANRAAA